MPHVQSNAPAFTLQRHVASARDESTTTVQPIPSFGGATGGQWQDVVGVLGGDALAWANRLVAQGNYRLVPAYVATTSRVGRTEIISYQRSAMSCRRRRVASYRPLALMCDRSDRSGMHVVSDPGFSHADVQPVRVSRDAASHARAVARIIAEFGLPQVRAILQPIVASTGQR